MRLFGRQFGGERKAPAVTVPASPEGGVATSLRSWEYPFHLALSQYVPMTVDYSQYDAIREGIPFIDTAIRKLARMCSGFAVHSDDEKADEQANAWLAQVRIGDVLHGFDTLEYSYVNSLLQYGKACVEIVLTKTGRDVYGLVMVPARNVKLIETANGLQLGEQGSVGQLTPYPQQDLFCYSALNVEGDNPHGTSILRSLPFVTNITLVMENALRQRWQRHGAPSWLVVNKMNPDLVGQQTSADAQTAAIKEQWNQAMRARWEQSAIVDFTISTQGDFTAEPLESRVNPEYVDPMRSLQEQIVSAVELAPFMLGLSWSTTERLSQQQADMIISYVDGVRREVEPAYMRMVDWYARLNGIRAEFKPVWSDVSLQDSVQTAEAALKTAQASKLAQDNALLSWANGFTDQAGAASLAGFETPPVVQRDEPFIPGQATGGASEAQVKSWDGYPA